MACQGSQPAHRSFSLLCPPYMLFLLQCGLSMAVAPLEIDVYCMGSSTVCSECLVWWQVVPFVPSAPPPPPLTLTLHFLTLFVLLSCLCLAFSELSYVYLNQGSIMVSAGLSHALQWVGWSCWNWLCPHRAAPAAHLRGHPLTPSSNTNKIFKSKLTAWVLL